MGRMSARSALFALLFAASYAAAQPKLSDQLYRSWLAEGLKREDAGAWSYAADCFREALRYRPGAPTATFHLARCLANLGRADRAVELLRELLRCRPERADAAAYLARLLRDRGDPKAALATAQSALAMAPDHAALLTEAGAALLSLGEPAKAMKYLKRAAAKEGANWRVHLLLGRCYAAVGKPLEAERHLLAAAKLNQQDPAARTDLAQLYLSTGRWLDALAVARELAARRPRDWHAWLLVGDAALALADAQQAAAAYTKAASLAPAGQRAKLAAAIARKAQAADLPEVVDAVLSSAQAPENAELAGLRARALEKLGRTAEAAELWEKWATQQPDYLAQAARCWVAAGNNERALRCLMRLGDRQPEALRQAARLALSAGDTDQAEVALRRMLAMRPSDSELQMALAELLASAGKFRRALLQAREAARQKPAEAARLAARIYSQAGHVEAALAAAKAAWQRSRAAADCELVAELLRRMGRWGELRRLLADAPKLTGRLALAAAQLALREGRPDAALKALKRTHQPEVAWLRCQALLALRRPTEAVRAAFAAKGRLTDVQLAAVIARAASDAAARRFAVAALKHRLAESGLSPPLAQALLAVLERELGQAKAIAAARELLAKHPASVALVAEAARRLAHIDAPRAAFGLVRQATEAARKSGTPSAELLALAARWALAAGEPTDAARFLAEAAAARGYPRIVAALTEAAHGPDFSPALVRAMRDLAEFWSAAPTHRPKLVCEGQVLMALMKACATEVDVEAWVAARRSEESDGAIVAAEHALSRGEPLAAVAALADAPDTPAAALVRARALLAAGRPAEAAAALKPLLGLADPAVHELAGDAAADCGDLELAAWCYAKALALGGAARVREKLSRACSSMSSQDAAMLKALAAAATLPARPAAASR